MMRVALKSELDALLIRRNLSQKEVAKESNIPFSTLNGYTKGTQEVPVNKAIDINNAVGDDVFASGISNKYLGTLKALDGKVSEVLTPTELDFLQDQETIQREERREQAKRLLIKSKLEPLNDQDKEDLEKYVMEFLDEIVVELSIVFSILKILGMTITEAFSKRMPHWVTKKYMKGE
ncbi:MAG: helix-turn-helix transcriptional regulator [Enterococcus sp.]|uniref:helix-turn-helix domain-containing protein n=1 Tax=Enterococcus sp. TaxID=35783 RepID=UPI002FC8729E